MAPLLVVKRWSSSSTFCKLSEYFPEAKHPAIFWNQSQLKAAKREGERWTNYKRRPELEASLDFRWASKWFAKARLNGPRAIHCHVGPTNSGKTHEALQKLLSSRRGIYCAPLRLLAMEMWDRLNAAGRQCGLRTGEYSAGPPNNLNTSWEDVPLVACTTEMVNLESEWDVAVIDEVQLMADDQRGWAFTQALLGINAREIYVCGEEAILPLIERIAKSLNETVRVHRYGRLSKLIVNDEPLCNLADLKAGDCVVSFSRNAIFDLKEAIEARLGQRCAVVYGSLPMENRAIQANKFNERADGYQIMVASDAVGMGLNLNIQRIVFAEIQQPGAILGTWRKVPSSRIKQIAGRAGRFGFNKNGNTIGEVTAFRKTDLKYVRECMETPNEEYLQAGLHPSHLHYERLFEQFPDLSLPALMNAISAVGRFDPEHQVCIGRDMYVLAYSLMAFPELSISDQLTLSTAPVSLRCHFNINTYRLFVEHISKRKPCPLDFDMRHFTNPRTYLGVVESFYRALDLYLWLGTRYPEVFVDKEMVSKKRKELSELVTSLLHKLTRKKMEKPLGNGAIPTLDRILDDVRSTIKGE